MKETFVNDYDSIRPVGHTDNGQPIVAEPGDGSKSDLDVKRDFESRKISPFDPARTTLYAREAGEHTNQWDRLWEKHHSWDSDDIGRRAYQDKLNVSKSLSNALGLSKCQKERVVAIVDSVNGRRFNQSGGLEALALGAIAFVRDQDAKKMDDRILGSEEFEEACDQHDVDGWEALRKLKRIV